MKNFDATGRLAALCCGVLFFLSGCYPGGPEIVGEYDLVATSFDRNFNFGQARTYLMPDSVVHVRDEYGQDQVSPAYDPFILQTIEAQMRAKGFTRLPNGTNQRADVVVLASVTGNTNVNVWSNPYDQWGWYNGWGGYSGLGSGWGYGYPGYYTPVTVTAYQTGSLVIQMLNPNQTQSSGSSQTIPAVWLATFNGILEGSPTSIRDRLVQGITQAFNQSTYLGSGTQ